MIMSNTEFKCPLCLKMSTVLWETLLREGPSCLNCGSSVRMREIVSAFVGFVENQIASDALIIGLSDSEQIEQYFNERFSEKYQNTYLDTEPKLNVVDPNSYQENLADVVISSDVFEHVFFPLSDALVGCQRILKPGGFLITTMPWTTFEPSVEHYPWMVSYTVQKMSDGNFMVIGTDKSGSPRVVENPIFHGGPGNTLEMRFINLFVFQDELVKAGFRLISTLLDDEPSYGIRRPEGRVGCIVAQCIK